MITTNIELSMMDTVDSIRKTYQHNSSSHAFTSLYIWQENMKLSILLEDDFFAVKYELRGENTWFFPCGNPDKIIAFIKDLMATGTFALSYIRKEDVAFLQEHFPDVFTIVANESDYEYLYNIKEEVELKGKKFARLRNDLSRLHRNHQVHTALIDDHNLSLAMNICARCSTKERFSVTGISDTYAKNCLLHNYKTLQGTGIITFLDGEPFAITMGFPLDDEVFDIGLSEQMDRVSGLLVYARTELMKLVQDRYTILNAEEDLGLEGLKIMKNIMRPIGFVEMYEVNFSE